MEYKRLGDIATYINGYPFKPEDRGLTGLPIIRIQDLTGNSYDLGFYNGNYPERIEINDGDVLISWSASLGVYIWNKGKALLNQHIFKVAFDKCEVNKQFFVYAVQYKLQEMGAKAHGATMKHIVKKDFDNTAIPFPALEEQEKIAQTMNRISRIISDRQQQLQKLDELVKARFIELFGDPMNGTSKWKVSTIGEQFNVTSGGTPATGEKAYWDNGTIPWIGSNMCQDTILIKNDGKFITEEGYIHSSAKWFYKGTVLVALVGATIGKTALLRFDTTTNQNIAAIDVNGNAAFSSEFVFYHMQMLYAKFMEIGNGKFKMANQGFIRQLPLVCPPLALQQRFAAFVEQVDKSKVAVQKTLYENKGII